MNIPGDSLHVSQQPCDFCSGFKIKNLKKNAVYLLKTTFDYLDYCNILIKQRAGEVPVPAKLQVRFG